jgi:noranthrone synthase
MVKAALGQQVTTLPTLQRNKDTWNVFSSTIAALYTSSHDIRWMEYHRDFKSSQEVLQLPAYNWDLKEYWIKYENDWCVTKGNPHATGMPQVTETGSNKTTPPAPKLETTTVHRLVEETIEAEEATIVVESDFSRPDLNSIAQGHKVNQIPLCTPVSVTLVLQLVGNCQLVLTIFLVCLC